jgi:hypothetical protein
MKTYLITIEEKGLIGNNRSFFIKQIKKNELKK